MTLLTELSSRLEHKDSRLTPIGDTVIVKDDLEVSSFCHFVEVPGSHGPSCPDFRDHDVPLLPITPARGGLSSLQALSGPSDSQQAQLQEQQQYIREYAATMMGGETGGRNAVVAPCASGDMTDHKTSLYVTAEGQVVRWDAAAVTPPLRHSGRPSSSTLRDRRVSGTTAVLDADSNNVGGVASAVEGARVGYTGGGATDATCSRKGIRRQDENALADDYLCKEGMFMKDPPGGGPLHGVEFLEGSTQDLEQSASSATASCSVEAPTESVLSRSAGKDITWPSYVDSGVCDVAAEICESFVTFFASEYEKWDLEEEERARVDGAVPTAEADKDDNVETEYVVTGK